MIGFSKTKPMQKELIKSTFKYLIICKTVNLKQLTTPSSCTLQKCESLILKQSTSYKESMDYKNSRFDLVE
jgi:hypothetical protein